MKSTDIFTDSSVTKELNLRKSSKSLNGQCMDYMAMCKGIRTHNIITSITFIIGAKTDNFLEAGDFV